MWPFSKREKKPSPVLKPYPASMPPMTALPPPAKSTPVVVVHIDFDTPTGNPLSEVRRRVHRKDYDA